MKIPADSLEHALRVLNLVPKRNGIEQSEYVQMTLKKGRLRFALGGDLAGEVATDCASNESWQFHIERDLLLPFVFTAPKGVKVKEFDLEVAGDQMTLKIGNRKCRYAKVAKQIAGYASVSEVTGDVEVKLTADMLKRLRLAGGYATMDLMHPQLNCIWFSKGNGFLASNSYSMAFIEAPVKVRGAFPIPFPELITPEMKVFLGRAASRLVLKEGAIWHSVHEKSRKSFPEARILGDVEKLKTAPVAFRTAATAFRNVTERLHTYVQAVTNADLELHLHGQKGDDRLTFDVLARQASFRESARLTEKLRGDVDERFLMRELLGFLDSLEEKSSVVLRYEARSHYYLSVPEQKIHIITARKEIAAK